MGECCELVNFTRHERVSGLHLGCATPHEWAWNPAASIVVAWYMLNHRGDDVRFVGDYQDDEHSRRNTSGFEDVEDRVVADLIKRQILKDFGKRWQDDIDPTLYTRDLRVNEDKGTFRILPPPKEGF